MNLPSRIKIKKNSKSYEVVWQSVIQGDEKCMGLADGQAKTITLKIGMTKEETLETFVHEILHVFTFEYPRLKIAHPLIYKLEKPIVNLIKLNGWLIF